MELLTSPSAPCPCCTFIDAEDLATAIMMKKDESLLRCKLCENGARERASDVVLGGKKGASSSASSKAAASGKGGKSSAASLSVSGANSKGAKAAAIIQAAKANAASNSMPTFVCLSCGFAVCPEHAIDHFNDASKKRSKSKGQRHREHHTVFLNLVASNAAAGDFRCYCIACDIPVGNLLQPADLDYRDTMDGFPINAEGHMICAEDDLVSNACIVVTQAVQVALAVRNGEKGSSKAALRKELGKHGIKDPKKLAKMEHRQRREERRRQMAAGGVYVPGQGGDDHHKSNRHITEQGIVGLTNLGNTCFFNSTMQCLLQLRSVRRRFDFVAENELPGPLTVALRRTVGLVETAAPGAVVAPRTLFSQLCARNPIFAEYGQQDAEDLMLTVINGVYDEYEVRAKRDGTFGAAAAAASGAQAAVARPGPGGACAANSCFADVGGELAYSVTCHECKTVCRRMEQVLDFNLSTNGCRSVLDALRSFFSPQVLSGDNSYLCERCNKEEYEQQKRAEEAMRRQREELTRRMLLEMEERGGLAVAEDEILRDSDSDSGSSSGDDDEEDGDDGDGDADANEASRLADQKGSSSSSKVAAAAAASPTKQPVAAATPAAVVEAPAPVEPAASVPAPAPTPAAAQPAVENNDGGAKTDDDGSDAAAAPAADAPSAPAEKKKNKYVEATCAASISTLRDVIVLHLKRFTLNWAKQRWEKSDAQVSFPAQLDLSEFAQAAPPADAKDAGDATPEKVVAVEAPKKPARDPDDVKRDEDVATLKAAYPRFAKGQLRRLLEAVGSVDVAMGFLVEGSDLGPREPGDDEDAADTSTSASGAASPSAASASSPSPSSLRYRLAGIVEHSGRVDGGHYVCYVRSMRTGAWYHMSDSWVKASSEAEALSAQGYLLFYERS